MDGMEFGEIDDETGGVCQNGMYFHEYRPSRDTLNHHEEGVREGYIDEDGNSLIDDDVFGDDDEMYPDFDDEDDDEDEYDEDY